MTEQPTTQTAWDRLLDLIDVTKAADANVSPSTAIADPRPRPKPPVVARLLSAAANWLAARKDQP